MTVQNEPDLAGIEAERTRIRAKYLRPVDERDASSARGLHHLAISMAPSGWKQVVDRLDEAGVDHVIHSEVSVYFTDPDGARIELIADPLGEMYGLEVL